MEIFNDIQISNLEYNYFFNVFFILILTFISGFYTYFYTGDAYLTILVSGFTSTIFYFIVNN